MKRILWPFVFLLLIVITLGTAGCDGFTSPSTQTNAEGVASGQNTGIWVTGTGEVTVTPDIAILQVGVEAQADTVAQAQSEASTAMNAIFGELDSFNIDDTDIQTQYFTISQRTRWDEERNEEVVTGYRVTNKMNVKIRSLPIESYPLEYKASNIIDAVVNAGGNYVRIDSISFTVDDPVPYQKEAREKALLDAREKAEQIADIADVSLGEPTYINETSYYPSPLQISYGLAVPAPVSGAASSISPGEMTITILVQVAYDIK